MTNLKLIISTRTQEEFDRVLEWAEQNEPFGRSATTIKRLHIWQVFHEKTVLFFDSDRAYFPLTWTVFKENDTFKKASEGFTFLSFPEFEKQYLISKQ